MTQAEVSQHFMEALAAMRPARDAPVSWELLGRLALVAHHPGIASSAAAGARAWLLVKQRLSVPVADIVAGTNVLGCRFPSKYASPSKIRSVM